MQTHFIMISHIKKCAQILKDIAYVLREIESVKGINRIELAEEMECLFACGKQLYENPEKKQKVLKQYTDLSAHNLSGNKVVLSLKMVCIIRVLHSAPALLSVSSENALYSTFLP